MTAYFLDSTKGRIQVKKKLVVSTTKTSWGANYQLFCDFLTGVRPTTYYFLIFNRGLDNK